MTARVVSAIPLWGKVDKYLLFNHPRLWMSQLHVILPIFFLVDGISITSNVAALSANTITFVLMALISLEILVVIFWINFQSHYSISVEFGVIHPKLWIIDHTINVMCLIVIISPSIIIGIMRFLPASANDYNAPFFIWHFVPFLALPLVLFLRRCGTKMMVTSLMYGIFAPDLGAVIAVMIHGLIVSVVGATEKPIDTFVYAAAWLLTPIAHVIIAYIRGGVVLRKFVLLATAFMILEVCWPFIYEIVDNYFVSFSVAVICSAPLVGFTKHMFVILTSVPDK